MDRRDSILKYVRKEQSGLEIGPWFNPLAPKREGYRCIVLDVFDAATLRQRALNDPIVPDDAAGTIEEVDLVGSSTSIGELVEAAGKAGMFDYVVSSHNFEHLPNPIKFLQGCARVLKHGGVLSMAIPDRRACFDFFRTVTRLSDWIQAYVDDRERPSPAQEFDSRELFAHVDDGVSVSYAFFRNGDPAKASVNLDLDQVCADWMTRLRDHDQIYRDSHCSVFTPASFELLVRDVSFLGLASFEVLEIFDAGCEFHAHLRYATSDAALRPANYEALRNQLLRKVQDEAAESSMQFQQLRIECDTLRAERDSLRGQQAVLQQTLKESRTNEAQAAISARELEQTLQGVQNSTSWRATAPIRRGVSILKSIGGSRR